MFQKSEMCKTLNGEKHRSYEKCISQMNCSVTNALFHYFRSLWVFGLEQIPSYNQWCRLCPAGSSMPFDSHHGWRECRCDLWMKCTHSCNSKNRQNRYQWIRKVHRLLEIVQDYPRSLFLPTDSWQLDLFYLYLLLARAEIWICTSTDITGLSTWRI